MKPCTTPGCPHPNKARGLCSTCYSEARRRSRGASVRVKPGERGCDVSGCSGVHYGLGLCEPHYRKQRRAGRVKAPTEAPAKAKPVKKRLALPTGWERTAPTPKRATGGGGVRDVPLVRETPPEVLREALERLRSHDAEDLAEMLGLAEVAA